CRRMFRATRPSDTRSDLPASPAIRFSPSDGLAPLWCWLAAWFLLLQPVAAALAAQTPVPPSWQQEYWAQFDKQDWDAAIASAEQLVATSRPATDATALKLAEALSLLGNAQFGKGNLVAAEAAFSESLALAEKYAGASSGKLVDPLRGLGYTLAAENKHDKAVPYMDRALLLSRRTAGLFDISQQGLLRQLAESLAAMGTPVDGEKHMLYLLRMGEHAYGEDDPRMIHLHCVVGDWYADVAQMDQARSSYRTALGIAERTAGRSDVAIVEPLRALASTFPQEVALSILGIPTHKDRLTSVPDESGEEVVQPYNPRFISMEGERALLRALKALDANPKRSTRTLIETLVQTGDWFLFKMQANKAMAYYERAASLIAANTAQSADADTIGAAAMLLSFPAQVFYQTPPLATRNLTLPQNAVTEHFVQIEFDVEPDGSIENEREVGHDGNARQVSQTLDAVRSARYRPKFVDGKPVQTVAVGYRQIFRQMRKDSE
ncbi:MAG TPA: hypothetical protein VKB34_20275, partial [Povalibacter sp.]|nr:hypothetical protein [Povalibacter sp.]